MSSPPTAFRRQGRWLSLMPSLALRRRTGRAFLTRHSSSSSRRRNTELDSLLWVLPPQQTLLRAAAAAAPSCCFRRDGTGAAPTVGRSHRDTSAVSGRTEAPLSSPPMIGWPVRSLSEDPTRPRKRTELVGHPAYCLLAGGRLKRTRRDHKARGHFLVSVCLRSETCTVCR